MACNNSDPRLLFEVDILNELNKVSPQVKYEFLKKNMAIAKKRSETFLRFITRAVEYGKYDEALNLLATNTINESEGAQEMQNAYLNSYTLRGINGIKKAKYDLALKDIQTALDYPIGVYGRSRYAQFNYLLGLIYKKTGDQKKASDFFQKTTEVSIVGGGADREYLYYKGLALQELGKSSEARQLFQDMLNDAQRKKDGSAFFTQFEGGQSADMQKATTHYLTGLAYEGLGEKGHNGIYRSLKNKSQSYLEQSTSGFTLRVKMPVFCDYVHMEGLCIVKHVILNTGY